jgi:hypothetical protein
MQMLNRVITKLKNDEVHHKLVSEYWELESDALSNLWLV